MEDIENKIEKAQILAEYGLRVFEFATINAQAKEQVEDFLKEPNPKNMFLLFMDLLLPMAESFVVYETKRGEAFGEFPFLKKDIKCRIEKLMREAKDEGNSSPDTKNQTLAKYTIVRDYIENK